MSYLGPERRVHTVYVTKNTEYHTRRDVCIAVRSLRTTIWTPGHDAVGMELVSTQPDEIAEGAPLLFRSPFTSVCTSPVQRTYRPDYPTYQVYGILRDIAPSLA